MDELLICLCEIIDGIIVLLYLTPNARNEHRENKKPVIPHWEIFCIFSLLVTILFLIYFKTYFKVELILYIIFAVFLGLIIWGVLYVIIINLANHIYLKITKRK